jgi:hypothetical protein
MPKNKILMLIFIWYSTHIDPNGDHAIHFYLSGTASMLSNVSISSVNINESFKEHPEEVMKVRDHVMEKKEFI